MTEHIEFEADCVECGDHIDGSYDVLEEDDRLVEMLDDVEAGDVIATTGFVFLDESGYFSQFGDKDEGALCETCLKNTDEYNKVLEEE